MRASEFVGEASCITKSTVDQHSTQSPGDHAIASPKPNDQPDREKLIRRRWLETGIKMWNPIVTVGGWRPEPRERPYRLPNNFRRAGAKPLPICFGWMSSCLCPLESHCDAPERVLIRQTPRGGKISPAISMRERSLLAL